MKNTRILPVAVAAIAMLTASGCQADRTGVIVDEAGNQVDERTAEIVTLSEKEEDRPRIHQGRQRVLEEKRKMLLIQQRAGKTLSEEELEIVRGGSAAEATAGEIRSNQAAARERMLKAREEFERQQAAEAAANREKPMQ